MNNSFLRASCKIRRLRSGLKSLLIISAIVAIGLIGGLPTFGMWALAAIGGIAVIAGGATQNIQVLIGGIVLWLYGNTRGGH